MGYQEREWNRDRDRDRPGFSNPINRSFRIGRFFGITVEIHLLFIIFVIVELLRTSLEGWLWFAVQSMTVLFFSVLLHEFGHCFGACWVGGTAKRIVMWPLGGLAFTEPPQRPGAQLVTTIAGPAVNLLLMVVSGAVLVVMYSGWEILPINPLHPVTPYLDLWRGAWEPTSLTAWLLATWGINYALLMFNLLPIYPMDGGRIVQELLWYKIGRRRSLLLSVTTGMIGAVGLGIFGLVTANWMLLGIAVFGYVECMRMQQELAAQPPSEPWQESLQAFKNPEPVARDPGPRKPWFWQRWREQHAENEEKMVDQILEKIHREGLNSLTNYEKRVLRNATERQKKKR